MRVGLSEDLRPLLERELAAGNTTETVRYFDGRAAVVLVGPFHVSRGDGVLGETVVPWKVDDPHYPDERYEGYQSTESGDVVCVRLK